MATLKRTDSNNMKGAPPRSCIACTEGESTIKLLRPCRTCDADYCVDCLIDMFTAATTDKTRMPPHCCNLIQLHAILEDLSEDQARDYRAKFEEWIAPVKTYCPSPKCSKFISEKRVPNEFGEAPSLNSILRDLVQKMTTKPAARFFRGEMDITQLPGYTCLVKHPIDLNMIQSHIDRYKSVSDLTKDISLIVSNAREYNGDGHPVTEAAHELFSNYVEGISNATNRLIVAKAVPRIFACPSCHVSICVSCKQVEHGEAQCDTSAADHELAMLQTFGYKRCPRCKAGIKRMFGCSHMQCHCGAHWCWWCQRTLELCDGTCDEQAFDEDEEDDNDSEEDNPERGGISRDVLNVLPGRNAGEADLARTEDAPGTTTDDRIVNLDAGDERRWGDGEYDFGEEPEEPFVQIWSCHHSFRLYKAPPDDGYLRGNLDRIECNRCFVRVEAQNPLTDEVARKKQRKMVRAKGALLAIDDDIGAVTTGKEAWECSGCHVVVCVECRHKYKQSQTP